jgi:hypothetical protein
MFVYLFYFTVILCVFLPVLFSVVTMYMSIISAATIGEAYRKGAENLRPVAAG